MTSPSASKLALRALADAPLDIEPPSMEDANAAVDTIARELDAVRVRRRRRRNAALATVGSLAAAISLVAGFKLLEAPQDAAAVQQVSGTVLVVRGAEGATLASGTSVRKGDRIVASASGTATLRLRKGTDLQATDGADLLVVEQGPSQLFELRSGAVRLHVTKLEHGERFVVRTADAEVEVRGTSFEVRVQPNQVCAGTTTRVAVSEGTVVVRHGGQEARVTANETWPAGCDGPVAVTPTASVAVAPSPPTPTPMMPGTFAPVMTPTPTTFVASNPVPKPTPMASSDLAEQNRLFAEAMAAKRLGQATAALDALDRLLASYPHGPLAESAWVERMRIQATIDPARGAEAARAYLARHPKGYAREEAKKLASP